MHNQWLAAIEARRPLRSDHDRIVEYTVDVVETVLARPSGMQGAMARFGSRLGGEGWTLEDASEWVELLARLCCSSVATSLRSFDCGVALARGWTEGHLHGLHADECFDGVTGMCTPAVLRLRLQQVFEHCAALGVPAGAVHRLVILDADISGVGALESDAVMVVLADLVQQKFTSGETIARDGSRIFVLATNSERLPITLTTLIEDAHRRSLLYAARVLGWIEDLPSSPTMIDRYIADIAA